MQKLELLTVVLCPALIFLLSCLVCLPFPALGHARGDACRDHGAVRYSV